MDTDARLAQRSYAAEDWGITLLRVIVGVVFLVHGAQKLFEFGIEGVAQTFAGMGFPAPQATAMFVSTLEFGGGIALILGLLTRWVAALFAFQMAVAVLAVHLKNGFFVNEGGYEFALLLGVASTAVALLGPGALAVDNLLARRGAHWVVPSRGYARARI